MQEKNTPAALQRRYEQLKARLEKLGPVLQGTITERIITLQDPKHPDKVRTQGPYYQWTFKRNAKTVTVNLAKEQAKVYQKAIDVHRKMDAIIQEMREVSLELLEKTTVGVKRRKPLV